MLITETTAEALWQRLVREAADSLNCQLDEELEAYLVFLLIRYSRHPSLGQRALALDFLKGLMAGGKLSQQSLRDVGDQCLLTSGLFPRRARRRRVQVSYYVDLGRSAYESLAISMNEAWAHVYRQASDGFVMLMDVLQAMRQHEGATPLLSPLEAYDLWSETGSRSAHRQLTDGDLIPMHVTVRQQQ
jgi:hypothetical protein